MSGRREWNYAEYHSLLLLLLLLLAYFNLKVNEPHINNNF